MRGIFVFLSALLILSSACLAQSENSTYSIIVKNQVWVGDIIDFRVVGNASGAIVRNVAVEITRPDGSRRVVPSNYLYSEKATMAGTYTIKVGSTEAKVIAKERPESEAGAEPNSLPPPEAGAESNNTTASKVNAETNNPPAPEVNAKPNTPAPAGENANNAPRHQAGAGLNSPPPPELANGPSIEDWNIATETAGCGVFVALIGLVLYYFGIKQYQIKKKMDYLPTCKALAVAPGLVEISGTAFPYDEPLTSPYGKQQCVYYNTLVYKASENGKSRDLVKVWGSSQPIVVADDTGYVLVYPDSGGFITSNVYIAQLKASTTPSEGKQDADSLRIMQFLQEFHKELASYGKMIFVEESYVPANSPVYVLGNAGEMQFEGGSSAMAIKNGLHEKYFVLSLDPEKKTSKSIWAIAYIEMLIGPLLLLSGFFLALTFAKYNGLENETLAIGASVAFLLYLGIAIINLLELYNGLIALRKNIDRANANMGALLVMRKDLIPQLAEVVKGLYAHESDILNAAANRGDLDSERKEILAILESNPGFKSNESVALFQSQLESLEGRIAASRQFCNDSVLLYNEKIGKFPFFLIALISGLKPIQYLQPSQPNQAVGQPSPVDEQPTPEQEQQSTEPDTSNSEPEQPSS